MKIPRRTKQQYLDWAYEIDPVTVAKVLAHRDQLWRVAAAARPYLAQDQGRNLLRQLDAAINK